jgi:hypothetical protein
MEDPVLQESTQIIVVGGKSAQASYDILQWPKILHANASDSIQQNILVYACKAYGLQNVSDLYSPAGKKIRKSLDFLSLISKESPPMYIQNGLDASLGDRNHMLHHPLHAKALWEQAKKVGLESRVYAPKIFLSAPSETLVDFFLWHLLTLPNL